MLTAFTLAMGPLGEAVARATAAMSVIQITPVVSTVGTLTPVQAEIERRQVARPTTGAVGTENAVEAEVRRRQVTRTNAGGPGTENALERDFHHQVAGKLLAGVGSINPTQAEIYRRIMGTYLKLPPAAKGLADVLKGL